MKWLQFLCLGSVSVGYHALNKESRRYFQRGFAMSGTPISYYADLKSNNHTDVVVDNAKSHGTNITNQLELMEYLKNVTAKEIFEDATHISSSERTFNVPWAPVYEGLAVVSIKCHGGNIRKA